MQPPLNSPMEIVPCARDGGAPSAAIVEAEINALIDLISSINIPITV